MATTITAGNATNGAAISSDGTGTLDIKTGTGAGTTALSIDASQVVTLPGNLIVTGTATIGGQPAGGNYAMNAYVSPTTWSKPAGLKAIKVTVVGAGGNGGNNPVAPAAGGGGGGGAAISYLPAPSIPGPVAVTAGGGTNSFGAFCSATAGAVGGATSALNAPGGAGGTGSGGTFNMSGSGGMSAFSVSTPATPSPVTRAIAGGGGSSILGGGAQALFQSTAQPAGIPGGNYGGGGGGSIRLGVPAPVATSGGTGAPGIVIVEEFY